MFLRHTELHVSDPLKSQKFYQEVLGFKTEEVQAGGKYVWMKLGDASILLRTRKGDVDNRPFHESRGNFVLCTEDPVGELKKMQAKGLEVRGTDGGCPTFTDPDGNWFQLIGPDGSFPA